MKKVLVISLLLLNSCATVYIKPTHTGITQQTTKTKKQTPLLNLLFITFTISFTLKY